MDINGEVVSQNNMLSGMVLVYMFYECKPIKCLCFFKGKKFLGCGQPSGRNFEEAEHDDEIWGGGSHVLSHCVRCICLLCDLLDRWDP